MDIKTSINQFLKERQSDKRYASFDFCYNYFYSFYKSKKLNELANNKNIQLSCLQLGFYLASWGMMRGSTFILQKSVRNYRKLITVISKIEPKLWKIDVDNYNDETIELILDCKQQIIEVLGKENSPTDTLITKIMLGIFANIPAFDQYFRKSFRVYSFNKKTLLKIKEFYDKNKKVFDSYQIPTLDFSTGKNTDLVYTKAKLIDMYGFIDGQNILVP